MLSHSRHMGACVYHSIGQVDPRFGNLVEWKWCHCVECLRLVFIWTTSNIHMRRIQKVFEPFVWCLKGILWMHPYTHVKVHWPSCPQIWEFRSLVEWKWCQYVIMVEAGDIIYLKPLQTFILDMYKVFEPLVCCLSKGNWVHPYTFNLRYKGHLWSENDIIMSCSRLIYISDHFKHSH